MRQIDYWDRTHFIKPSVSEAVGHAIPVHKGKPIKQGLLLNQLDKAGLTFEQLMKYYR